MKKFTIFTLGSVIAAIWFWFVTYGTGDLRGEKPEVWGTAFDYLAQNLWKGEVDVPGEAIGFEGIERDNKTYLYFGPFPAFIRMLPNLLWPEMFGHWSRISCFGAALLALIALCLVVTLSVRSNSRLTDRTARLVELYLITGFGLASPLLFLVSDSMIFLEPILWGLAFSFWGIAAITGCLNRIWTPRAALTLLSICAGAALVSRITFAIPLYLSFAILALMELKHRRMSFSHILLSSFPAIAGLLLQLWYNHARFDSFTSTRSFQMAHSGLALFGAEFNLFAIPVSALNYFLFRPEAFSFDPPYIHSLKLIFALPGLFLDWHERVVPLMVCSPWLLWLGAMGVRTACTRAPLVKRLLCLAFAVQVVIILSWHFITQRYLGDLLPLFVLLISIAVTEIDPFTLKRQRGVLAILLTIGLVATPLSTIDFHLSAVGDTGKAKDNRTLLYSLFYSPPSIPTTGTPLVIESRQEGCAIDRAISARGYNLPDGFSLSRGCVYQASISPAARLIQLSVALSDHTHECEGQKSHLMIRTQDGTPLYFSNTLTQRKPFLAVSFPVHELKVIVLTFEGLAESCARGLIISPLSLEAPAKG